MKLIACSACARHLKIEERSCPFCGQPRVGAHAGLAAAVLGAALAAGACGDDPMPTPLYGLPAMTDASVAPDAAPVDAGS